MAVDGSHFKFKLHDHGGRHESSRYSNDAAVDGFEIWRVKTG